MDAATGVRAGAAAGAAVGTAALAHAAAGGTVAPAGAAWAFAALVLPAAWLVRRPRGWTVLAAAQLVAQQVAHVLLDSGGHGGGMLPADLMLYLHLVAAAATGLVLRLGGRRAAAVVAEALHLARLLVGGLPAGSGSAQRQPAPHPARLAVRLLADVRAGRAPPLPA